MVQGFTSAFGRKCSTSCSIFPSSGFSQKQHFEYLQLDIYALDLAPKRFEIRALRRARKVGDQRRRVGKPFLIHLSDCRAKLRFRNSVPNHSSTSVPLLISRINCRGASLSPERIRSVICAVADASPRPCALQAEEVAEQNLVGVQAVNALLQPFSDVRFVFAPTSA